MGKVSLMLKAVEMKLDHIIKPKILRSIIVGVEIALMAIAFLFVCIGLGMLAPVSKYENGYHEWNNFYITELVFALLALICFILIIFFSVILLVIIHLLNNSVFPL